MKYTVRVLGVLFALIALALPVLTSAIGPGPAKTFSPSSGAAPNVASIGQGGLNRPDVAMQLVTGTPTNTPTDTPTNTPTSTPTDTPTSTPTDTPTSTPTSTPTDTPT
ncbi:MAG TPA: hypothetical protein VEQ36_07870, partial [Thermomicrobiales bacterium]|nr:hypothetical protein [Thermomicrobiales bacterium]